jgi:hypothetical protein
MVLICDNKILSIETFHKNRCREKNEKLEIMIRLQHEAEMEEEASSKPALPPIRFGKKPEDSDALFLCKK